MAARLNTRFIVILMAAAIVVIGGGGFLAYTVLNKTGEDYVRMAEEAERIGDWQTAVRMWERAVGHENSSVPWLTSWREAYNNLVPENLQEATEMWNELRSIQNQLAEVQQDNPEAQEEWLALLLHSFDRLGADAESWIALASEADGSLEYLPDPLVYGASADSDEETAYSRVLRYRAIAGLEQLRRADMGSEARQRTRDDLERCLRSLPNDARLVRALAEWYEIESRRLRGEHRLVDSQQAWAQALQTLQTFVTDYPGDTLAISRYVQLVLMDTQQRAAEAESEEEIPAIFQSGQERAMQLLVQAEQTALANPDPDALAPLIWERGLLVQIDRADGRERALAIAEGVLENDPNNSWYLRTKAGLLRNLGRYDEAVATLQRIVDLPNPGAGLDGYALFFEKPNAVAAQFDIIMENCRRSSEAADVEAALAAAEEVSERFLTYLVASEEDLRVWWMRGQLAHARGLHSEAIRWLQQVQSGGGGSNPLQVTLLLSESLERRSQLGDAERLLAMAFEDLQVHDPLWLPTWARLIGVQEQLSMWEAGCDNLEKVIAVYEPSSDIAQQLMIKHQEFARKGELEDRIGMYQVTNRDPLQEALRRATELTQQGELQQAKQLLLSYESRHSDDYRLHYTLGLLEHALGDDEAALARFIETLRLNPEFKLADVQRQRIEGRPLLDLQIEQVMGNANYTDAERALALWHVYKNAGMEEEAAAQFEEAGRLDPRNPTIVESRFMQALADQDWEAAQQVVGIATEDNLDQAKGMLFQARMQLAQGDAQASITVLNDVIEANPYIADAHRLRGQALYMTGDKRSAVRDLQRTLDSRPDDIVVIKMLSQVLSELNQNQPALELARRGRKLAPNDDALVELWARLESSDGDPIQVRDYFHDRYEQDPGDDLDARRYVRLLIRTRNFDDARPILDKLVEEHGDQLQVVHEEALWYAEQGGTENLSKGRQVYLDYMARQDLEETGLQAYIALGEFLLSYGQLDMAVAAFKEASKLQSPQRMEGDFLLANAYRAEADHEQASAHYRAVIDSDIDPTEATARVSAIRLVDSLIQTGDFQEAERRLNAIEPYLQDDEFRHYVYWAQVHRANGNIAQARQALDEAVASNPNNDLVYVERARFNKDDEAMAADALSDLARALEIRPNSRTALELVAQMLHEAGDINGALSAQAKTLEFYPDDKALRLRYVSNLKLLGENEAALGALIDGMERDPRDADWPLEIGRFLTALGQYERARVYMEKAYEVSGRHPNVGLLYADIILKIAFPKENSAARQADLEFAIRLLERHREDLVRFPNYHNLMASSLAGLGRTQEARQALIRGWQVSSDTEYSEPQRLIERWFFATRDVYGTDIDTIAALINEVTGGDVPPQMRLALGRHIVMAVPQRAGQGLQILEPLMNDTAVETPTRIAAAMLLGTVYFGVGEFERVVALYENTLTDIIPAVPADGIDRNASARLECTNNLAYILSEKLGRHSEALPYARQAAEMSPDDANVMDTLGWVEFKAGDVEGAERNLTRSIDLREMPANVLHMAEVLLSEGDTTNARLYLQRAPFIISPEQTDQMEELRRLEQLLSEAE